jgi:hypothetical protein
MGRIRNVSGERLEVPAMGARVILPNQVVEVSDDDVYSYTQQTTTWAPADVDTTTLHDEDEARYVRLLEQTDDPVAPSGNASRDEWVTYVVAARLASEGELEGLGRDAIRDQYGPAASGQPVDAEPAPVGPTQPTNLATPDSAPEGVDHTPETTIDTDGSVTA